MPDRADGSVFNQQTPGASGVLKEGKCNSNSLPKQRPKTHTYDNEHPVPSQINSDTTFSLASVHLSGDIGQIIGQVS